MKKKLRKVWDKNWWNGKGKGLRVKRGPFKSRDKSDTRWWGTSKGWNISVFFFIKPGWLLRTILGERAGLRILPCLWKRRGDWDIEIGCKRERERNPETLLPIAFQTVHWHSASRNNEISRIRGKMHASETLVCLRHCAVQWEFPSLFQTFIKRIENSN